MVQHSISESMSTVQTERASAKSRDYVFMRRVLLANAIFSVISGIDLILFSNPIAAFLGIQSPLILMLVGISLLGFAWLVFRVSRETPFDRAKGTAIFAADVLWVIGSAAILATNLFGLNTAGNWAVLIVALIVADFAAMEWYGLQVGLQNDKKRD